MSFESLQGIIGKIKQQPNWETHRLYCLVVESWPEIVNAKTAKHSRPVYLARETLWVATANSVWAQTLSLQRVSILRGLNKVIPEKIKEVRFSAAKWSQTPISQVNLTSRTSHPSSLPQLEGDNFQEQNLEKSTAKAALSAWIKTVETRSNTLPLCPRCQSPTPPGELDRWSICAFCLAHKVQENSE